MDIEFLEIWECAMGDLECPLLRELETESVHRDPEAVLRALTLARWQRPPFWGL